MPILKPSYFISIALTILCCTVSPFSYGQVDRVISYNIRYDNPNDSLNRWDNRKAEVADMIRHYAPDVIGLQEGLDHQLVYLDKQLDIYSRIGVARDDGHRKGEYSPIYYNHNLFTVVDQATFWLSDQDDRVSVGWDASMERICTYGIFENKKSPQRILILNTHYDHRGPKAREMSSKLIIKKIAEINTHNYPVILMGDFNAPPESKPIQVITETLNTPPTDVIYGPIGTFTGFEENAIPTRRIDYIFTKDLEVINYRHVDDKRKNNLYLSDHLPVMINIK